MNKKNPRKTWMLIGVLSSRKCGRARNISEMKVNIEPITSAVERTEVLNDYFATIGSNLTSEICFNGSLSAREEHLEKKRFNTFEILTVGLHDTTD